MKYLIWELNPKANSLLCHPLRWDIQQERKGGCGESGALLGRARAFDSRHHFSSAQARTSRWRQVTPEEARSCEPLRRVNRARDGKESSTSGSLCYPWSGPIVVLFWFQKAWPLREDSYETPCDCKIMPHGFQAPVLGVGVEEGVLAWGEDALALPCWSQSACPILTYITYFYIFIYILVIY